MTLAMRPEAPEKKKGYRRRRATRAVERVSREPREVRRLVRVKSPVQSRSPQGHHAPRERLVRQLAE